MTERDRRGPESGQDLEQELDELQELEAKNEYGEPSRGWWPGRRSRTLETLAHATRQSGEPLPHAVRRRLERVIGEDLSSVRLHATDASAAAARALDAEAFTIGRDVHLGAGRLDPSSRSGLGLLAHEVAHASMPQIGAGGRGVSDPSEPAERYAHGVADFVMGRCSGRPALDRPPASSARIFRTPLDGRPHRESVGESTQGRGDQHDAPRDVTVMGQQFRGESHYEWGVVENLLWIQVRIQFLGDTRGLVPTWIGAIHSTWNRFHAVKRGTNERVWIRFNVGADGTPHRTVRAVQGTGQGANEGEWDTNVAPERQGAMASHEFGHMIGLEDEYYRSHADLSRVTGRPTREGRHPAQTPAEYAQHLREIIHTMNNLQRRSAVERLRNEVETGTWTDQVAAAYRQLTGAVLFTDIRTHVPADLQAYMLDTFYPSDQTSPMGGLCPAGATCPVQTARPQHMQRFMRHIAQIRGGAWDPRA